MNRVSFDSESVGPNAEDQNELTPQPGPSRRLSTNAAYTESKATGVEVEDPGKNCPPSPPETDFNDDVNVGLDLGVAADIDNIGLPRLPEIPELILCLHFPGTEGWHNHWIAFTRKVKEFHQAMIDFNWKILEWYSLKSKQLERFGVKNPYVAGTLITGPRMTIIQSNPLNDNDVLSEVKKCVPEHVSREVKILEAKGFKLCVSGKIFIFDYHKIIVVDFTQESDKSYRNCVKFTLFNKNRKVNIFKDYNRVYGGLKYSFIIGGVGGLITSFLTGYFNSPPLHLKRCCTEPSIVWKVVKRIAAPSLLFSLIERILLLKFSQPQKCVISGSTGLICGTLIGLCDNCDPETTLYAATEFGIFSLLCNAVLKKHVMRYSLLQEGCQE